MKPPPTGLFTVCPNNDYRFKQFTGWLITVALVAQRVINLATDVTGVITVL